MMMRVAVSLSEAHQSCESAELSCNHFPGIHASSVRTIAPIGFDGASEEAFGREFLLHCRRLYCCPVPSQPSDPYIAGSERIDQ
jgi:hypothetical protein